MNFLWSAWRNISKGGWESGDYPFLHQTDGKNGNSPREMCGKLPLPSWELYHRTDTVQIAKNRDTHGLINFVDPKAKCRHLKKFTCKATLRQVFIRVYRLEIQSSMLVFGPALVTVAPILYSPPLENTSRSMDASFLTNFQPTTIDGKGTFHVPINNRWPT